MSDLEAKEFVTKMCKAMSDAVGEALYEKSIEEVLIYGTILPATQLEIQRRMSAAVGLDHPIHPDPLPPAK